MSFDAASYVLGLASGKGTVEIDGKNCVFVYDGNGTLTYQAVTEDTEGGEGNAE